MRANTKRAFDAKLFLGSAGVARKVVHYPAAAVIFSQGDPCDTVLYIQDGRVKLFVTSRALRVGERSPFRLTDRERDTTWDLTGEVIWAQNLVSGLNRVGVRLQPVEKIDVKLPTEMLSCGAQFGTLQWHADGSLVALGPDHPVTGGYMQPMTVITSERWKLAQLSPGERITLKIV